MNLKNQIKYYRKEFQLSQDDLADKIFVTRQTISNWETGKNYPDVHSLLLLSALFHISVDELIKGDIDDIRNIINGESIEKMKRLSYVFSLLLGVLIISGIPLFLFLEWIGTLLWGIIFVVTMAFAIKIENIKKAYDVQTYKEVVAFFDGKTLDDYHKTMELGKRNYQKVAYFFVSAMITFLITGIIFVIIKQFL